MLSPKRSQIAAAAGTFGTEEQQLWLPLIVGSVIYNASYPPVFSDVDTKLAAVTENSLQAKQLNATMMLIDRIGPVAASTTGAEGKYSTEANREGLLEYALSVLYGTDFWPRMHVIPQSYRVRNRAVIR